MDETKRWEKTYQRLAKDDQVSNVMLNMLCILHERLQALESAKAAQRESGDQPATMESPITILPSAAELDSMPRVIQPLSLPPGDQMVADLFHAGHCSECAAALGVLLAQCRMHAQAVGGRTSTSQRAGMQSSAGLEEAGAASPSQDSINDFNPSKTGRFDGES